MNSIPQAGPATLAAMQARQQAAAQSWYEGRYGLANTLSPLADMAGKNAGLGQYCGIGSGPSRTENWLKSDFEEYMAEARKEFDAEGVK